MDDNKNLNQPNTSTPNNDDYQKILDEYAASVKPEEETKDISHISEDTVKLEEIKEDQLHLKDINPLQLEAPDNKSIPADIPSQKTNTPLINDLPKQEFSDATSTIKSPILNQPVENLPPKPSVDEVKTPSLDLPHKVPESQPTETKTPEEIKAQIDRIFADDSSSSDNFSSASPSSSRGKSGAKTIFFLSVAIFFLVAFGWIYFLYFYQQSNNNTNTNTDNNNVSPTPTEVIVEETCELNGTTYKVGESFKSADGCNTCSCQTGNMIACTEMACDISPIVTSPATKSATKTPAKITVVPTKKVVSVTPTKATITPIKTATSSTKKVPTVTPILDSSEE